MLRMMKIVEVAWLVIASICVIEVIRLWDDPGVTKWYFLAGIGFGIFMFFFRRKQRIRYERIKAEKENSEQE